MFAVLFSFGNLQKYMHSALSRIAKMVELRMFINSLILVIVMAMKCVSYAQFTFNFSVFGIPVASVYNVSADLFSMINPLLLLAVSATVRSMLVQFLRGRKFQP